MRKLTLSLAVLAALMPGRGYPLGLGEIELNSALNQELEAEIEVLSAEPEIAEQLIIKLASRDAFARAGIDRPFLLQQLKFKVITKGKTPYVMVYTQKPVREPFLSFLLEVDWPEGHLLREYTILLDPPVYSGTAQASAPSVPPAAMESGRPFAGTDEQMMEQMDAEYAPTTGRPATSAYAAPSAKQSGQSVAAPGSAPAPGGQGMTYRAMPQYNQMADEYRVQQNDTLWSLANKMRPDQSVSVEQMMLALVRENPESFIEENIHGIKRGYILRMPNRAAITAVDRQTAITQVREHTALWREYRQSQSATSPASAMEAPEGAELDQPAMEQDVEGKLSIVSVQGDKAGESTAGQAPGGNELKRLRAELALAKESLESERLEKENLKSRLDELENRVKRVLEMDDTELAKLQQDLQGVKEDAAAVKPAPVPFMAEEPAMQEEMPAEEPAPVEEPLPVEEPALAPGEEPVFVDQAPAEMMEPQEPVEEVAPAPKPIPPAAVPTFAQQKPRSFIENLLDDPKMLGAAGGVLVLILALIGMLLRRRRINKTDEEWVADEDIAPLRFAKDEDTSVADIAASEETSEFEDTQIQAPGEQQASLEDTVYSLKDEEEAPKEEVRDDVIAEADVYLAYGIYQQAEELLRSAIDKNPERDDYRMKLLETHFAAKNSDAFAGLAEEVKARKGSDKAYWNRVLAMGSELCPDNALFSDTGVLPDIDTDDLLPKKPETTDLELDASDTSATDFDLGLGDDLDLGETPSFDEDADATQILNEPLDLDNLGAAADTDLSLDTDLGGLGGELELDDAFAEPMEKETAKEELDSGFDLGELDDVIAEPEMTAEKADEDETPALDIDDDFSLDFEASDLGFASVEEEKAAESEETESAIDTDDMSLEFDAALDLGMDMETPAEETETAVNDLDMSMDLDREMAEEPVELDMDMTDDLSLDTDMAGISAAEDDDFDISELSEDVDEISTKLDLARAYLDMGDREGAKSILEEVKQEGNDSQQQEAEALLKQAS